MYQPSLGFSMSLRKTRKAIFLDQMDRVVPWSRLVDLIAPYYPAGRTGRPPFELETMLRTHFLQQWFNLSDPAMEEAFFDTPLYREFVGLADNVRLPDESTILRFRHRLEKHALAVKILVEVNAVLSERGLMLKEGSAVDATLIAAPSSTKNKDKARDPEMHSSQKGNQWHFGMKAHIGVDADSGLVHTVRCTSGNAHDITQAHRLLHGHEKSVWADAGYQGVEKRPGADPNVAWHVAMRPGKRKTLKNAGGTMGDMLDKAEKLKAGVRAKVEHPFRVIKRQFGFARVRYKGLAKNAAQIATLFALSNVWMARQHLMGAQA
ncbi:MAG: IS5 family transposase [Hydrogenophaga sp.]|nr:IS5 family transposase [Hydrogenophaga sp.]MDO9253620.1 IS5 family transposase [Hydrogenophaga sp.]MDP3326264.1 IS5 family transposase [Hydrogenophaga sp.]MDP3883323.1 IS5 family transposase [Hydrogenophaga sp.]